MSDTSKIIDLLEQVSKEIAEVKLATKDHSNLSPWMRKRDAARHIGIGHTKLQSLIDSGRLKSNRVDGLVRIHRRDCDSLLVYQKPFSKLTKPQKIIVSQYGE